MSRHEARGLDIDGWLQDSYLLAVEVSNSETLQGSEALWKRCLELVETLRERLREAGLSQRSMDLISHAQCALLDETVLGKCKGPEHEAWARESLQVRLFNSHQAGEWLYEQLREVLREPSPDPLVLTVFQRVLHLGFKGRYKQLDDPEREQLIAALDQRVAPLVPRHGLSGGAGRALFGGLWSGSPWRNGLVAGLLLAAVWWGLDLMLAGLLVSLLPGQG